MSLILNELTQGYIDSQYTRRIAYEEERAYIKNELKGNLDAQARFDFFVFLGWAVDDLDVPFDGRWDIEYLCGCTAGAAGR